MNFNKCTIRTKKETVVSFLNNKEFQKKRGKRREKPLEVGQAKYLALKHSMWEGQAISKVRGASKKGRLPGGTDQASGSRGLAPHFPAPAS